MNIFKKDNNAVDNGEDFSLIIKLIKVFSLFLFFLVVFSLALVKAFGSEEIKNEIKNEVNGNIDIVSLSHNCFSVDNCYFNNLPVSVNLGSDGSIDLVKYYASFNSKEDCFKELDMYAIAYKNGDFFPVNTKSYVKGIYSLNNRSYLLDLNCVNKILVLKIKQME